MDRCVRPELLDKLPAEDPRAIRSRRDLQRLNAWMGNAEIMARSLRSACRHAPPRRIVELGAGDGTFLLRVAQRAPADWRGITAQLLDRLPLVGPETRAALASLGWQVETTPCDVLDWSRQPATGPCDAIVANLFLHHFSEAQLAGLFLAAARCAPVFIAVEPRRAPLPLTMSRLVWFIGCNSVTRRDAPASVRAGFTGRELSGLWPAGEDWQLEERRAGWSSHLFVARRGGSR